MDTAIKRISLLEAAGAGATIVMLQADAAPSRIAPILAQHFRVLRYAVNDSGTASSSELAAALASQSADPVGLIADTATAHVAFALMATRSGLISALALLAPPVPDRAFAELKTPVLALFGTRALQPQIGRRLREAIASCHVMLVYDADDTMANQRPEAVAAALREFMLAGDRFLVTGKSGKLYP
jgi:pimeloyl-ACP methyl ester carboxylesterase